MQQPVRTPAGLVCLNADCHFLHETGMAYGNQYDLPALDDTCWPICVSCLEPLHLEELIEPNHELLECLAHEAFEHADVQGLCHLRAICARMIEEHGGRVEEKAGGRGIASTQALSLCLPTPGAKQSIPHGRKTRTFLSSFAVCASCFSGFVIF